MIPNSRSQLVTATEMDLSCARGLMVQPQVNGGPHLAGQIPAGCIAEKREFKQISTGNVSRLSANREGITLTNGLRNGLWTCRGFNPSIPVGIYGRDTGKLL